MLYRRSLLFHWRTNLATALCVATAGAVLTGALVVGDSMRASLLDLAVRRLGPVDCALVTGHFFREALASDVSNNRQFKASGADACPLILLQGIEPNLRWKTFSHEIVALGKELGARKLVTLGAFLADVPHTRAVPVVGSASNPDEAEDLGLAPSRYEGPTGIVGVMHDIANRGGLPSVSFWAAVPHYVPSGENPKAAIALLRRFAAYINVDLDVSELEPEAQAWEDSVTDQVRDNEDLVDYIRGLEESDEPGVEPNGEDLANEIERFLERRNGGDAS